MKLASTILLISGVVVAQTKSASPPKSSAATPAAPKASDTETEIARLRAEVNTLREQVRTNENILNYVSNRTASIPSETVTLDPASPKTYEPLRISGGLLLLVSLEDVTPYLDGVRVSLEFGNPFSVTLNGFDATSTYGPRYDFEKYTAESYAKRQAAMKTRTEKLTTNLRPGTWNAVTLTLPEIKPADFGSLTLSIKIGTLSLGTDRRDLVP